MDQDQNTTILCIDDEEDICFALKTLFRTQGWNTITACDVNTGLKLFTQQRPTIVLIDYHMPGINGVDGVRMLRQMSATVAHHRVHHRRVPKGGRRVSGCWSQ